MATLNIIAQFLQQPKDNDSFGYTIVKNGTPITYSATSTDFISKTFKSSINESVGHIVGLDEGSNYYLIDEFKVGFNNTVIDISRQTSGKYIVSGNFTEYNGQSAKGICRLNTDFSLDTSFTPPDLQAFSSNTYNVSHRLLSNDRIIVFGGLMQCGTSYYIGKLNVNGTIDTGFRANTGFYDGVTTTPYVNDIAIDDNDNIICVGSFLNYSYFVGVTPTVVAINKIIRLTSNGSYDSSFVIGSGIAGTPREVEWSPTFAGGDGYVIGGGTSYKGVSYGGLIKIDLNGDKITLYDSLTQTTGSIVTGMFMDALGYLTVSGNFNAYDGTSCPNIIRIKDDGTKDTAFVTTGGLSVPADVIKSDGYLYTYVGGGFNSYKGSSALGFAKIDYTNGDLLENTGQFNDRIYAILLTGLIVQPLLIGGAFTNYSNSAGVNNNTIIPIAINSVTTQYLTWQNLIDFNSYPDITYSQVLNNVIISYTYSTGDTITVINTFDSPGYVELTVNGENIPPVINLLNYPQAFTPIYNPITFTFNSPYYNRYGFRYLFNITNAKDNSVIGEYNLSPNIIGDGFININKVLSNLTSVDFTPNSLYDNDATNSYVDYNISIGAEFSEKWYYQNVNTYTGTSIYSGYTLLTNVVDISHSYVAGDQINISSSLTSNSLNGLHQVVEVVSNTKIVIDLPFIVGTDTSTSGSTIYADNRKTSYLDVVIISGLTAFNGARSWSDFINWVDNDYTITSGVTETNFLSNIPNSGFTITGEQDIWLNVHTTPLTGSSYIVVAETSNNITSFIQEINSTSNSVQQIAVGFNQIKDIFPDCYPNPSVGCIDYYDVYILIGGDPDKRVSKKIRFTLDKRCKIEDYEILFMDRMGSLASYAFQLRAMEKGNITRNTIKQQVDYNLSNESYSNAYDITERGTAITNINLVKTLELNTNWMSDEMSVYFEELLTSPYTWIKINNQYLACTINDTDFEVVRQKNKNLIRKTITITMANNNPLNI